MPPVVRPKERQPPDVVAVVLLTERQQPQRRLRKSVARQLSDVAPLDGFARGPALVRPETVVAWHGRGLRSILDMEESTTHGSTHHCRPTSAS